jgi:hypothetical protein
MTLGQSEENVSLHSLKAYNIYLDNMTANEDIFGLILIKNFGLIFVLSSAV